MTIFIPSPRLLDSPRHRRWTAWGPPDAGPAPGRPPATADVVIVGAGPAGLATAAALWHRGIRNVVLLERSGQLCGRFFKRTDNLRQRVLRSQYEHHPGAEGYRDCELLDFARLHWEVLTPLERREIRMAQAGHRSVVPIDVFEAFCRHVATIHGVSGRTWRATVRELDPGPDEVRIRTDDFEMTAGFAVLCTGEVRRPAPVSWWPDASPSGRLSVSYWDEPVPPDLDRLVVIGAGLSAAHLLANALREGRHAAWIFRAATERYQCSDVNAAFFRAEGRARFDGEAWQTRLARMRAERRASVMFEFRPLLESAEASGQLTVHRGHAVAGFVGGLRGPAGVRLADGSVIAGNHVVLALGTSPSAGEDLLPSSLTGARDGWPDLDEATLTYRRAPRVLAVGAAAGMVLGPAARNLDGHRVAAARAAAAVVVGLRYGVPSSASYQDEADEEMAAHE
ncbi:MAG TPA: FAD-dependent oxidoreductase [Streptosporangiaceae bacterium]